ncbi:MAG: hypothetical protein D9V45_06965 [Chloroflexi bacterium]|nr:MAG: hypothetical protein D9V45_06965 [Chloroflexota bacterium]
MPRSKRRIEPTVIADLPEFAAAAAQRMGIDPATLRSWVMRPDGSVVLLCANGMKFVVSPD